MKRFTLLFICLLSFLFTVKTGYAQQGIKYPDDKKIPEVKILSSGKVENFRINAQNRAKSGVQPTANFRVTYNGFTEDAKVAFAKAVELWSYLVYSTDTIRIDATWKTLELGVLGSCSPTTFYRNFKNAPIVYTWYPIALANKLAGYDLAPEQSDITANFSRSINWYLGLDGNCPNDQYDFISVVMHELGHGLGFIGSGNVDENLGEWGWGTNIPLIYDRYVINNDDQYIIDTETFTNPSSQLKLQFTSNSLFYNSESSVAANGGNNVKLYAPAEWNPGSSYSHLDEIFNGTVNSMMTYSSGSGEVTHDPGPVTLGMFEDMGWIRPLFVHNEILDMESMPDPITVELDIYADSSITPGTVKMHYSLNNFSTETIVDMTTANDTLYTAELPNVANDNTYSYYFEAQNGQNKTYYFPVQGVENITSIDTVFSFYVGDDIIGPDIIHDQTITTASVTTEQFEFTVECKDNIELDSIYLEYKINDNTSKMITCDFVQYTIYDNYPIYNVTVSLTDEGLADGDIFKYKFHAVDRAGTPNTSELPGTGYFEIEIFDVTDPVNEVVITFDESDIDSKFIFDGLFVDQPTNFSSACLNSPHPYEEGDGLNSENEIYYRATLKSPVIIRDSEAYIQFDQVAIIEPGDDGATYGSSNFWDYAVIEGSKDNGDTWHDFENGWDCTISSAFLNAYNAGSDGTESMYEWKRVDMLSTSNFAADDTVLVRFTLYSDQLTVGWGWALDNLKIQGNVASTNDIISNSKLKVYPNPATDNLNIELVSEEMIEDIDISIYNVAGKLIYLNNKSVNSKLYIENIDISDLNKGIYIIKINSELNSITKKLIVK